ncbi:MAG TPA: phenylalanine--tRNA ligase beta subunit-related protein, partial [Anaerolineales bacterium]
LYGGVGCGTDSAPGGWKPGSLMLSRASNGPQKHPPEVLMFRPSDDWKKAYPEAHAGVLVLREAANPPHDAGLANRKAALEESLRLRYAGQDRAALLRNPTLRAYDEYYKRFKKTYHVQLQLESILFKGKSIPNVAALVESMFMAEMDGLLLTAGHDLDVLHLPLTLDIATGKESYTLLRGEEQVPKAGDMMIRDGEGIVSSVIYGPDQRTQVTAGTRSAVFTIYAPAGIQPLDVSRQLEAIRDNVLVIAPKARVELLEVYAAG